MIEQFYLTLTGNTTPGQSGLESNVNIPHSPNSRTGATPSDAV